MSWWSGRQYEETPSGNGDGLSCAEHPDETARPSASLVARPVGAAELVLDLRIGDIEVEPVARHELAPEPGLRLGLGAENAPAADRQAAREPEAIDPVGLHQILNEPVVQPHRDPAEPRLAQDAAEQSRLDVGLVPYERARRPPRERNRRGRWRRRLRRAGAAVPSPVEAASVGRALPAGAPSGQERAAEARPARRLGREALPRVGARRSRRARRRHGRRGTLRAARAGASPQASHGPVRAAAAAQRALGQRGRPESARKSPTSFGRIRGDRSGDPTSPHATPGSACNPHRCGAIPLTERRRSRTDRAWAPSAV